MEPEVVPAILAKTREELLHRISQVNGLTGQIQIDIMDGDFVPNKTVGIGDLRRLPDANYEFHWMVRNPEKWIAQVPGPYVHLVHVEAVETMAVFSTIKNTVKKAGGKIGIAINPETPLESFLHLIPQVQRVLIMSVHPGLSGQAYLPQVEQKIKHLRRIYPALDIEVDGGLNQQTIGRAYAAGANLLAAASAIFSSNNIKSAITGLRKAALAGYPA